MPFNSSSDRAGHFFSLSHQCPYPHKSVGYPDQENPEWEPFGNTDTIGTIHNPNGCIQCRIYSRHVEESTVSCGPSESTQSARYSEGIPNRTYQDGIRLGRRIQEEEDHHLLSRYREQIHWFHERYEDSLQQQSSYRHDLERMEAEVAILKDNISAMQVAYDDVTMSTSSGRSSAAHQRETTHSPGNGCIEAESVFGLLHSSI